ncbi:collagen alpha-5 chain [Echria macrotheca]|uniref:Collagen alpha-5 chain n=1 Tax=Echria macrotheca TaxID=438768 RepID=A0AAJ0BMD7_9PEZI|nr:collagen alpha-5 chain [Echria macrotheca]
MASQSRSLFDSFVGKLSRKGSNRSTKSNMSSHSTRDRSRERGVESNPFVSDRSASALAPAPIPDSRAPPPSYSEATATSGANPTITVQAPIQPARAASPAPSGASRVSLASLSTPEDPYAFLSTFDTIFVIDDSGSMAGRSWREVKEALRAITPICTAHDADGIDVYFLNARNNRHQNGGWTNLRRPEDVENLFSQVRPGGGTPTGTRINQIMKPYLRGYEQAIARTGGDPDNSGVKPVNMIVITDGVPTDDPESVIVSIAKKLDKIEAPPYQVGIQFFQVGNERGAAEALQELDDSLGDVAAGVRDIVDTVTWSGRDGREHVLTANGILKVVLGAVVRRLDRRRVSGEAARPERDRLRP